MTPNDLTAVLIVIASLNLVALTFIGWRLRAPINVTITQPPITVQSPPAILPPELLDLMRQTQEKLQPPPLPALTETLLVKLVEEGIALAEQMKGAKGPDKFRNARTYVLEQAKALGCAVDERALALRIEAVVLAKRPGKK